MILGFDEDPRYAESEERAFFEKNMESIREKVLDNLSPIEKCALFEEYNEFCYLYRQELEEQAAEYLHHEDAS